MGKKRTLSGPKIKEKVLSLAKDKTSNGFARGGATACRKDGGKVEGDEPAMNLAKRARGGRTSAPFSAAHSLSGRSGKSGAGHEGEC